MATPSLIVLNNKVATPAPNNIHHGLFAKRSFRSFFNVELFSFTGVMRSLVPAKHNKNKIEAMIPKQPLHIPNP